MVVASDKTVSELDLVVPSNLEIGVESMIEQMRDVGTLIAPRPQPFVFMNFIPSEDKPDFLDGLYMPLDLPIVQEVYAHYRNGKHIHLSVRVTEKNRFEKSRFPKPLSFVSDFIRQNVSWDKPLIRNFEGTLEIENEPLYDLGFSRIYVHAMPPTTRFSYIRQQE